MSDSNSLMNIGDLAKPVTTLIEKIADATGVICAPWQIKRVAKAEAEAAKTKALADIEITEIQRRAMIRLLAEETKKQENIENITVKALPEVKKDAKPEEIDNDWLANFFDRCKLVSDEQMQTIWANLLAGESNKPGTFSKRTIDIVSSLDKVDAELFTNLCEFSISKIRPLIYDTRNPVYVTRGINFESLNNLDSFGLISFANLPFILNGLSRNSAFRYFDSILKLSFPNEDTSINIGRVVLTKSGMELALICNPQKNEDFLEYLEKHWKEQKYDVTVTKGSVINNYFSFTLDIPKQSEGKEIERIKEVISKLFNVKEIHFYNLENSRYQFTVNLSNLLLEVDLLDEFYAFESLAGYQIETYSFN